MKAKKSSVKCYRNRNLVFVPCESLFDYGGRYKDRYFVLDKDCGYGYFSHRSTLTKGQILDKYGLLID